jgi:ectoine hydroxylase-related dioxygenase (phytanoyl-CoA dioxygenase family)
MLATRGLNTSTAEFGTLGYVVVRGVLPPAEADELYGAFDGLPMVTDHSEIIGWRSEANERTLVADNRFLRLVTSPRLLECVRTVIGDDLQLIDTIGMEIGPASGLERAWHVDLPFFTYPACLSAIAGVYLTDMTPEMGPLYLVPGSHEWERSPEPSEKGVPLDGEVEIAVPAGSAVVFNSQLWHTGTRNTTERPRRAIFLHFAHYWMKRMDEFYADPLPEVVRESEDPLVRQLFGIELAAQSIWGPDYRRGREKVRV